MPDAPVILPFQPRLREGRLWDASNLAIKLPELVDPKAPYSGSAPDIRIDTGDVLVQIGAPAIRGTRTQDENQNFGANLAENLAAGNTSLPNEIYEGVSADITSCTPWTQQYQAALPLLGTKIEEPNQGGQRRGMSKVGHPLMLEAIVKYWASGTGEMLPAAGPAKIVTVGRTSEEESLRAKDFEDDFNYLMTDVLKEYYPDTSNMLVHQGFCGLGYKKIYRDPIRRRPTSQSIHAPNLIVSEEAADLSTATRVTHQIEMSRSMLKRMQIRGGYLDIDLPPPSVGMGLGQIAQRAVQQLQGLTPTAIRPQDAPYLIWETDIDLDPGAWGITGKFERAAPDGMPLPYKVVIDSTSQQLLGVWRNWRPDDDLYLKRNMFVKYGLVPSLGYHNWGFMHLLGNQTRALRAIWRILIDAGMFSNLPGGLKAKDARTSTNELAPGPGEWVEVDAVMGQGFDIRQLFMPMPYNPPNAALIQLSEIIKNDAMRLGATVQIEVGEGRTNVPVGTIMAMVEQQMQIMAAVHKTNHQAQKEELLLLRELFAEDVDSLNKFLKLRPRPGDTQPRIWSAADEFMDLNLQPASDPNVPAQSMRLIQGNVLVMLAQQAPQIFNVPEVAKYAVQMIGADPDRFISPPDAQQPQPPDPKALQSILMSQAKQQQMIMEAQKADTQAQVAREKIAAETAQAVAQNETQRAVAQLKEQGEKDRLAAQSPGLAVGV